MNNLKKQLENKENNQTEIFYQRDEIMVNYFMKLSIFYKYHYQEKKKEYEEEFNKKYICWEFAKDFQNFRCTSKEYNQYKETLNKEFYSKIEGNFLSRVKNLLLKCISDIEIEIEEKEIEIEEIEIEIEEIEIEIEEKEIEEKEKEIKKEIEEIKKEIEEKEKEIKEIKKEIKEIKEIKKEIKEIKKEEIKIKKEEIKIKKEEIKIKKEEIKEIKKEEKEIKIKKEEIKIKKEEIENKRRKEIKEIKEIKKEIKEIENKRRKEIEIEIKIEEALEICRYYKNIFNISDDTSYEIRWDGEDKKITYLNSTYIDQYNNKNTMSYIDDGKFHFGDYNFIKKSLGEKLMDYISSMCTRVCTWIKVKILGENSQVDNADIQVYDSQEKNLQNGKILDNDNKYDQAMKRYKYKKNSILRNNSSCKSLDNSKLQF